MALQVNEFSEATFSEGDITDYLNRSSLATVIGGDFASQASLDDETLARTTAVTSIQSSIAGLDTRVTALETEIDGGTYQ